MRRSDSGRDTKILSVENIPIFLNYAATQNEVRSLTSYFKEQMPTSK